MRAFIFIVALFFSVMATDAWAKYASIIVDADTGRVLHEDHADDRNYPASLTKMMTLYLLFEAIETDKVKLADQFTVSKYASSRQPSKLGLKPGSTISVKTAILALAVKSANDVAVVIAENLAGSEKNFASVMTQKARRLGMSSTTFKNASGLHNKNQKSSARDMVKLGMALYSNFPQFYRYFSVKQFSYNGKVYKSHNKLLTKYNGTDGIKTGYVRASGFNIVVSVERNGRRLFAVVMGGKNGRWRDKRAMILLNTAYRRN